MNLDAFHRWHIFYFSPPPPMYLYSYMVLIAYKVKYLGPLDTQHNAMLDRAIVAIRTLTFAFPASEFVIV